MHELLTQGEEEPQANVFGGLCLTYLGGRGEYSFNNGV